VGIPAAPGKTEHKRQTAGRDGNEHKFENGKWSPKARGRVAPSGDCKNSASSSRAPPEPFGAYVEAVQTGNLLFLSGMLPTEGHGAKFIGRVGAEFGVEEGVRRRTRRAHVLAVARQHLGSLDKVTRVVRLGVSVATSGDIRDQPKVADAASELLQDVFGKDKNPCRLVYGVASLPLGTPLSWKSFSRWLDERGLQHTFIQLLRSDS